MTRVGHGLVENSPGNWDGQNKLIFNTSLNSIIFRIESCWNPVHPDVVGVDTTQGPGGEDQWMFSRQRGSI